MKKRLIAVFILVCTLLGTLAGCASEIYNYDKYDDYLKLGNPDNLEIFLSEINNGVKDAYRGSVKKEDVKDKEYKSANDKILIEHGDTANIDYEGKIDGVAFEGGSATKKDLTIGSKTFIDGFETGLIGYTVGDKVVLDLKFPDDYHNDKYKGKKVQFTVTINAIKRKEYPEYNDENVKKYTEYETVAKFEEETRKTVVKNLLWQEYFKACKVAKYPEKELRKYYESAVDSASQNAAMFGMSLEKFVTAYYGYSNLAGFYKFAASNAQKSVKQELIVLAFIEKYPNLKFTEEQYNTKCEELYNKYIKEKTFEGSFKSFKKKFDRKSIELTLYYEVVMDYLVSKRTEVDDITKNGFVKDRVGIRYYVDNVFYKGWHELEIDGKKELYYFNDETGYAPEKCDLVIPQGEKEAKYLEFGENGRYVGIYDGRYDNALGTRFFDHGKLITGWQDLDLNNDGKNEKYFLHLESGYMLKGIQKADDELYHDFGKDGVHVGIVTDGLHADERGTRYFKDGKLLTGWQEIDADKDGKNEKYYFVPDKDGYMCVNATIKIDDIYHTFNDKGVYVGIANGLIKDALGIRYFKDGKLQTGEHSIKENDKVNMYYFKDVDGYAIMSDWYKVKEGDKEVNKFYYDKDGHKVLDQTLTIDGVTYVFDKNGNFTVKEPEKK